MRKKPDLPRQARKRLRKHAEKSEVIQRAKTEEALRESEEEYKYLFDNIPIGIYRTTPEGRILRANPALVRMLGYSSFDELASHNLEEPGFQPYYDRNKFKELLKNQNEIMGFESVWTKKDGTSLFTRESARAVKGKDGTTLYYEGTVEDITERKQAEERFRLAVESALNAIVMVNQQGTITFVNSQTERLFGYSKDELIGQSVEILVPERFRSNHSKFRLQFYGDPRARPMGAGRDLFALRKDGSEFPVEIGLNPVKTADGIIVLSSIVDITERKRAEEALRENEQKLKAIMDNTTDAILVYDEDGRIITINKKGESLFSGDSKKRLESIWDTIPSEERIKFSEKLKSVKEGNKLLDYEMQKILDNGDRIPVSVGLVYVPEGVGWFIETVRDVRERVALRNKIIELEKAQIVGRMAEGIAHHMGTPLASMLLRVQMLKEDVPSAFEYEKYLEKLDSIERQIFYSQKVIQRLLKFVSKPENEKSLDNISNILDDAAEITNPLFKKRGIKLELKVDEDLYVLADSNLLGLVFVDIMMNALDAMPEGGKLSVLASGGIREGMIEIIMSDTGSGIPRDILPFVFEPFFTTKPAGKGTGLGLSVAKRIIHDHGGEISIDSREGKGTSVIIKLPAYAEEKQIEQA
jgi:PAS domain S-box-containing protein